MIALRPPLPPPLSHEGIEFVPSRVSTSKRLSEKEVALIAVAIAHLLPAGDFVVDQAGGFSFSSSEILSPWREAARLESLRGA